MAYVNPRITQLGATLESYTDPSNERVDTLNDLAWELWTTQPERATELTHEASALAEKLDYPRGKAYAKVNRGMLEWRTNIAGSLELFAEALVWFEEHDEPVGAANVLNFIAIIYWGIGDLQRGLDHSLKSLKLHKTVDDPEGSGWTHQTLSGFHLDLKQYEQAKEYATKAYEIFKGCENKLGEARALNGMGNALLHLGDCKKALEYLEESLRQSREMEHEFSISRALNDIGLVYQKRSDYAGALPFHQESLRLREELDYPTGQTTSLLDLANAYVNVGETEKGIAAIERSMSLAKEINAKPKIARGHMALAMIYENLGSFEQALEHFKQHFELEQSIFSEDAERKMKNMQAVFEREATQKEAEIFRLKNVELKEKNEQLQHTLEELNSTQAQLLQAGKMMALGNLVAGIAHEINTPIGTIKSGADLASRVAGKLLKSLDGDSDEAAVNKELNKTLPLLQSSTENTFLAVERIMKIVNGLKNFARLDEAEFQLADITEGLESTLLLIAHEIPATVKVDLQYADLPKIYCFPTELNQVFMNIILNALQAMRNGGTLTIRTEQSAEHILISICDTGVGIAEENLKSLFEPGFSSGASRMKMKTGLYTSYGIVARHRGDIQVESTIGRGTKFSITIATDLQNYMSPLSSAS
ncbi:MAG: tetratricopeptide repeat-containing sensor histidine kinase [Calditrichia bacterium]